MAGTHNPLLPEMATVIETVRGNAQHQNVPRAFR